MDSIDDKKLTWWQKGIIYQVYIKSFKDSNGDGVGDLRGVIEKIDYFKLIGVDIIFINPFYPHGGKDNGYDLTSYYDIDPVFGTMSDFDDLVDQLHKNDMYLVIDFIPNHTSSLHEWFIKSCESDSPDNPYRDYYIWYPTDDAVNPPNNWVPIIGKSAWTYNETRKAWYYHTFLPEQPDLNMRCPKVKDEMKKILNFWIRDKKVDGVRIDAAKHLFVHESFKDEPKSAELYAADPSHLFETLDHVYTLNQPETFEILVEWREYIDEIGKDVNKEKLLFVESYGSPKDISVYLHHNGKPAASFPLNFQLLNLCENDKICLSNIRVITPFEPHTLKSLIDEWNMCKDTKYFWSNWELGNHDCARIATRVGLENASFANVLCLLLGGTAFTYYGEEIGMEDLDYGSLSFEECKDEFAKTFGPVNFIKYNRDYCRSPMQWDSTSNAGFTSPDAKEPWLKVCPNYVSKNVKKQLESPPNSILKIYMKLARIRQNPSFLHGQFEYAIINEHIFSFIRKANGHPAFLVALNLSQKEVTTDFHSIEITPSIAKVVYFFQINNEESTFTPNQKIALQNVTLPPKSCLILNWI